VHVHVHVGTCVHVCITLLRDAKKTEQRQSNVWVWRRLRHSLQHCVPNRRKRQRERERVRKKESQTFKREHKNKRERAKERVSHRGKDNETQEDIQRQSERQNKSIHTHVELIYTNTYIIVRFEVEAYKKE